MLSTTASYLAVSSNLTRMQAATAASPQVKTDTAYFLANIGKVTSVADFVGNYRLFSYAMKAFGLEDMNYAKGLMTKVLDGGVTSSTALANTLGANYKAFATAFDFAGQGTYVTQTAAATTAVVSKYVEQSLEDKEGTQNQGVQLALYFTRNASSITNLYGLLADKNMLKVVETAFGLPSSTTADIDYARGKTLSTYVSVSDLQDPTKVQKIAERFTAMWDLAGNNTSSDVSNVTQIFAASSSTAGVGADLLLSLQGLRLGGS